MEFRDQMLEGMGTTRLNSMPPDVLRALGLSQPVPGVSHVPQRSAYRAHYPVNGKRRARSFYYRRVSEVDAYAAAIAFRKQFVERPVSDRALTTKDD